MKKLILLATIILLVFNSVFAQESTKDSLRSESKEEYVHKRWNRLIPKQTNLQFAGSMGFLSASVGWHYGKKSQWETDVFLGFLPKGNNDQTHLIFTLKETYTPWKISVGTNTFYEPLTTGVYITKIFGENFWSKLPSRYPDGYYFWATDTRVNIFLGQAITFKLSPSTFSKKELSFYYQLSTNDLYIISAYGNKTISATNIVGLSLGIRYRFF